VLGWRRAGAVQPAAGHLRRAECRRQPRLWRGHRRPGVLLGRRRGRTGLAPL